MRKKKGGGIINKYINYQRQCKSYLLSTEIKAVSIVCEKLWREFGFLANVNKSTNGDVVSIEKLSFF